MARVHYEADDGVTQVVLASPQTGNALGAELLRELREALERATAPGASRVVVLRAEGEEFCRGLDLQAFVGGGRPGRPVLRALADCLLLLARSPAPVIAQVEQNALGGGVGLVAACDMVLAAPHVVFSLPESVVGMIPALVSPVLLRRLTPGAVRHLTLSTRAIDAREALVLGLVDEVIEDDLEAAVVRQIQRALRSSPDGLAEIKRFLDALGPVDLAGQIELALETLEAWLDRPGTSEGVRSFAEGLSPPWFARYRRKRSA